MSVAKPAGRRSPLLRVIVLGLILVAGIALVRWTPLGELMTEERLVAALLEIRQIWWAPLALLMLYTLLSPLGVSMVPLLVAGAIFGPVLAALYNSSGLILGACASFWVARVLGRDYVVQITGDRFRKAERLADRHGFWPLVQTRFLPLPFAVVNFGAALAGVDPRRFVVASIVGLVPSTVIHSYFIAKLMFVAGEERLDYGLAYGATFVLFNLLIGIPWIRAQRRRRARYHALIEARASRTFRGSC